HRKAPGSAAIGRPGHQECCGGASAVASRTIGGASHPGDVDGAVSADSQIAELVDTLRKDLHFVYRHGRPGGAAIMRMRDGYLAVAAHRELGDGNVQGVDTGAARAGIYLQPVFVGQTTVEERGNC